MGVCVGGGWVGVGVGGGGEGVGVRGEGVGVGGGVCVCVWGGGGSPFEPTFLSRWCIFSCELLSQGYISGVLAPNYRLFSLNFSYLGDIWAKNS